MLATTCSRWASLELQCLDSLEPFQGIRFDLAKELRELYAPISSTSLGDEFKTAFLTSLFTIPLLTHLELHSDSRENILQLAQKFSWNSLLTMDLSWDCPCEFIAQAISKCTSITYLSVKITQPINDPTAFPKHIALSSLQVLLIEYKFDDIFTLFSSLECPNLCILELKPLVLAHSNSMEEPLGLLASFLRQGKHRIQVFRLLVGATGLNSYLIDVLLGCQRAGIPDVGLAITDPLTYPDDWDHSLGVFAGALENVPTSLPSLVIRSCPRDNPMVVGWFERSRTTVWWQPDQWPYDSLDMHNDDTTE